MPNYVEWLPAEPARRVQIARKNLTDNPHIATWWFIKRYSLLKELVLKPKLGVTDFWGRTEFQARGSIHAHEFLWCMIDGLMVLKENDTEENRRAFCKIWGLTITAMNPAPDRETAPEGERSALQMHHDEVENTVGHLSNIVSRTSIHKCGNYCLRTKKGDPPTAPKHCRFHYPRPPNMDEMNIDSAGGVDQHHVPPPRLTNQWHPKYASFEAVRNDPNVLPFNRLASMSWRANCDFMPCTSKSAVINYIAKYASKAEETSKSYKDIMTSVLGRTSPDGRLHTVVASYLCAFISERDWSAAEVSQLLLNMPLSHSSRSVIGVDCRPESQHNSRFIANEDNELQQGISILEKYKCRDTAAENVTYLDFLLHYTHKSPHCRRPRAQPRILHYMPYYKRDVRPEDFYRVKAMMNHSFRGSVEDLKEGFDSWASRYQHCVATQCSCQQAEDFLDQEVPTPDADDDEFENELDTPEASQATLAWAEIAHARPVAVDVEETLGDLGRRDIDLNHDWLQDGVDAALYAQVQAGTEYWDELKQQHPMRSEVRHIEQGQESTLIGTQREVYNYLMSHYKYELDNGRHPDDNRQLLLHIDGSAGTGKSYLIEMVSSHLAQLAASRGRGDPVVRCAPTGVAAHNISGYTLHRLFHISPQKPEDPISDNQRSRMQVEFRDIRYIIIDEKSMVSLRMLGILHSRCCEAFPEYNHLPFGGVNVIICGDFAQLPPVMGKALYMPMSSNITKQSEIVGVEMYSKFNRTVTLTHIVRQAGEDEESRAFREVLNSLRDAALTEQQWSMLTRRIQSNLTLTEVDEFADALRIFPVKTSVSSYNVQKLRALQSPVIIVEATNTGSDKAKNAPTDIASNLHATLPLSINCRVMLSSNIWVQCGLVNGAIGTVRRILWKPDTTRPQDTQPAVVFVEFDEYTPGLTGSISIDGRCCVPVFPVTNEFYYDGQECSRTQLPLTLAYAITVHKSQGISVSKAVLDISQKEFSPGLSYVAISRVRTFKGLMFTKSFDYERFKRPPSRPGRPNIMTLRINDTVRRALQPLEQFDPTVPGHVPVSPQRN